MRPTLGSALMKTQLCSWTLQWKYYVSEPTNQCTTDSKNF